MIPVFGCRSVSPEMEAEIGAHMVARSPERGRVRLPPALNVQPPTRAQAHSAAKAAAEGEIPGMLPAHRRLLAYVCEHGPTARNKALAEAIDVPSHSLAAAARFLDGRGLVKADPGPVKSVRHPKMIRPTDDGREALARIQNSLDR